MQPLRECDATKRRESFEIIQHISQGRSEATRLHMFARTLFYFSLASSRGKKCNKYETISGCGCFMFAALERAPHELIFEQVTYKQ